MKIATWNVNSVRKRTGNLVAWLERAKPDVVVLQEIKAQEAQFPRARDRGRRLQGRDRRPEGLQRRRPALAASGRDHRPHPARRRGRRAGALHRRQDHDAEGAAHRRRPLPAQRQSHRHREVRLQDRLDGPARTSAPGRCWRARRCSCWAATTMSARPTIDVFSPKAFADDALCQPQSRAALRTLLNLGLTDAVRAFHVDRPALHLLGLSGRRLAEGQRPAHRPPAAVAAGRRPPDRRRHRQGRARPARAVRPRPGVVRARRRSVVSLERRATRRPCRSRRRRR